MEFTQQTAGAPAVVGVADTRSTTLDRLAGDARAAADSLRHVLPADETVRVAVAAFGSSI
jgi:FXSXX-COOH protein